MRKGLLLSVATAGLVLTGVTATGVFAPITDTATTGTATKEKVETGVFAATVDLKIAAPPPASNAPCSSLTFTDDLTTPLLTWTDAASDPGWESRLLCIRNAGTAPVSIQLDVIDFVSSEVTCEQEELPPCNVNGDLWVEFEADMNPSRSDAGCPDTTLISTPTVNGPSLVLVRPTSPTATWQSDGPIPPGATCSWGVRAIPTGPTAVRNSIGGYALGPESQTDRTEWRYRLTTI